MTKKMPSPQERPDLYDDFDYVERPEGYRTGVAVPSRIQRMIEERRAKKPASKIAREVAE